MASSVSAEFFENGSNVQFEWVLGKYQETLQAKAELKAGKAEALLKLDKWYQNELPKKIKSRGKEAHLTHEEIVQTIKWKLARGVFRPRLKDLIQMNTPRVVLQESKKAFRAIFKRNDLESAMNALSNLKGVGPAMASAVLAAGCPDLAPFMADELLLSMGDTEGIDYTMKEYMKLVAKTQACCDRLNEEGGSWTPHKVELAVWTHYVARDVKPEILGDMPLRHQAKVDRFPSMVEQEEAAAPATNGEVSPEEKVEEDEQKGEGEKEKNYDAAAYSLPASFNADELPAAVVPEVSLPEETNGAESNAVTNGQETHAVTNGQQTNGVANGQESNGPESSLVTNGQESNGHAGGSEVPETSSPEVTPAQPAINGSSNGATNGEMHEAPQAQNNGHGEEEYAPVEQLVTKRPLEQDDQEVPESKRAREGEDSTPPQLAEGAVLPSQPQPILSGGE